MVTRKLNLYYNSLLPYKFSDRKVGQMIQLARFRKAFLKFLSNLLKRSNPSEKPGSSQKIKIAKILIRQFFLRLIKTDS